MNRNMILKQVLEPTVRIRAASSVGSGTIIKSEPWDSSKKTGGTWVLTNRHVVAKCIEYKEVWDELLRRTIKKEIVNQMEIDKHRLDKEGRVLGTQSAKASIVISNEQQDLALLKVYDTEVYTSAKIFPEDQANNIPMLVKLLCCGAALGKEPVVTEGFLNGQKIDVNGYDYYLSGAPSIFGNSGGSIFTQYDIKKNSFPDDSNSSDWYYVGIPSMVSVEVDLFSIDAITHMGYFIPIDRIYAWLRDNRYQFLWDDSITEEECDSLREQKRQEELALHSMRENG